MPFEKGKEKTGGRKAGVPNKKTQQWESFASYCLEGGLEKFERELNKLEGKDYVNTFIGILEYHKPKLARTQIDGLENLQVPDIHLTLNDSNPTKD